MEELIRFLQSDHGNIEWIRLYPMNDRDIRETVYPVDEYKTILQLLCTDNDTISYGQLFRHDESYCTQYIEIKNVDCRFWVSIKLHIMV